MPSSSLRDRVSAVRESIVAYLDQNPAGADTADGIREAWLEGAAAAEEVDLALEELIAEGVIVERVLPDGSVLFTRASRS